MRIRSRNSPPPVEKEAVTDAIDFNPEMVFEGMDELRGLLTIAEKEDRDADSSTRAMMETAREYLTQADQLLSMMKLRDALEDTAQHASSTGHASNFEHESTRLNQEIDTQEAAVYELRDRIIAQQIGNALISDTESATAKELLTQAFEHPDGPTGGMTREQLRRSRNALIMLASKAMVRAPRPLSMIVGGTLGVITKYPSATLWICFISAEIGKSIYSRTRRKDQLNAEFWQKTLEYSLSDPTARRELLRIVRTYANEERARTDALLQFIHEQLSRKAHDRELTPATIAGDVLEAALFVSIIMAVTNPEAARKRIEPILEYISRALL